MSHPINTPEPLRRAIGGVSLGTIALNGLIGAGIFALPAAAAERAGSFSPMMFVIGGALIATVVAAFAQVASYFNHTGGPVLYAQTAFGSAIGFQTGWLLYFGRVTAFAANTNALVSYGAGLWPEMNTGLARAGFILLVCTFLTWVNIIGVKRGVGTTNLLTVLKLLPLFVFIGVGVIYLKPAGLIYADPPAIDSFAGTLLLLMYAYVGFEGAVIPAGESINPRRDMPRALFATLIFTMILYVMIQAICLSVSPDLAATDTPLADVAAVMVGPVGGLIMTLAAFFSIFGNLSAIMIAAPRMTYAMARDRSLPNWFGGAHTTFKTPANSILFTGILTLVLAVSGSFVWLAVMSSLTRMLGYAVCIGALPFVKRQFSHIKGLQLPFGYFIPAAGLILCLWLALQAKPMAWLMTAAFVLLGSVLYTLTRRSHRETI